MYQLSLFIFRRDLRLNDNTALYESLRDSASVIPCFIFDNRQIKSNDYFGEKSFAFLLQSLEDLQAQLSQKNGRLYYFQGNADTVINKLINALPIEAVFTNRDYTPFSIQRDTAIESAVCGKGLDFNQYDDALLHEPEAVLKANGSPYLVYTPFMKRARQIDPYPSQRHPKGQYYQKPIASSDQAVFKELKKKYNQPLIIPGGTSAGKKLLTKATKIKQYDKVRDLPALDGTTHLSPHHKFGTLSIREVYEALVSAHGKSHTLINELYWRDFFTQIAFYFPHVFKGAFNEKYNKIKWRKSIKDFERWCAGETGFPIVDAGMRELNETGYMHNRVRMITASFLVKDLHINWQWGEKYFAQKLIDYDPAVNNGNWQWAASTGCDAQPYFRIFNPDSQQKRFDPDCEYINRWAPDAADIEPIVDHKKASAEAKALFKNCK